MSDGHAVLAGARVAVISSHLWPGHNELWDAIAPEVSALTVIGGSSRDDAGDLEPARIALPEWDLGRGLVWQHMVGLRRHLRSFRPDLVHVNRELWAVTAQEVVGLDTAVVVHGAENLWHHGSSLEQLLRRRLVDRALRRIRGYASWNHAGAEHVVSRRRALGLGPIATLVMPGIIPPVRFRRHAWTPDSLDAPTLELLLVGRASVEKGFADVIEAVSGMPRVHITLCGTGPLLGDLEKLASERRVALSARGQLGQAELLAVMQKSHLLVQPSRTMPYVAEQFGRSVAEAMTLGLPCLVSSCGELPYLVGHDPQAVFDEGDVTEIRNRLSSLASPGALAAMSARQRALAEQWTPAVAGAAVLDLWHRSMR